MEKNRGIRELEIGILEYLYRKGYTQSYNEFRKESDIDVFHPKQNGEDTIVQNPRVNHLLEKKWSSASNLQQKVIELEEELKQKKENKKESQFNKNYLPKPPKLLEMSGHRMAITAVLFHPIYNLLFTGSEDCTIRVWDYENGGYERSIKGHTKPIHQLAVSNEKGSLLASCSSDLSIKIWDINNDYQCIKTLMGHDHSVSSIKFSPNNDLLLSASRDKSIKVWEVSTGYCLKTINGNSEWIRSIDISLDCSTIVAGSFDHMVRTYDFNSGELKNILKAHNNVVEYVNFLPVQSYPFIKDLCDLNTIPNVPGQFIISCSRDKTLALYNIQGQVLYQFKGHDNWVKQMVVTGGGKFMLSISDDKTLKAWDLQTGRVLRTILLDEQFPTSIAMSKDGLYCATTFPDGKISIWNCFK